MEIGNIIKGPGARAPRFKVKNIICTDQYGKTKWFPLHLKPTFRIIF